MSCTFSRGCVFPALPGRDICGYHHRHMNNESIYFSKTVTRDLGLEPNPGPTTPHRTPKLLSNQQIEEIERRRASTKITQRELAEEYHVSKSLIQLVLHRRKVMLQKVA